MNGNEFLLFHAIGDIDERFEQEAEEGKYPAKTVPVRKAISIAAAILLLLLLFGIGISAVQKRYSLDEKLPLPYMFDCRQASSVDALIVPLSD